MSVSNRAYSLLEIKSYDDDKRTITGIATTPSADRMGDIVESEGAEFQLPIPLLWQHDHSQPIGHVTEAKVSKKGIVITAKIERIDEEGVLKNRLDEAWQSIKHGLVRGLSIGFKPIESARIEETYSYRFIKWLWLELSAVTIPANGDCSISTIKSIDTALRAATGQTQSDAVFVGGSALLGNSVAVITPPAPGKHLTKTVKAQEAKSIMTKKTYAEQISAFETTLAAKNAAIDAIMDAAAEKGETLDAEQKDQCDTLEAEVKEIGEHLVRLRAAEERSRKSAVAVNGVSASAAAESRASAPAHSVQVRRALPKGYGFVRLLGARYMAREYNMPAWQIAESKGWGDEIVNLLKVPKDEIMKAAISAASTTDSTWAGPLVTYNNLQEEFIELLRPKTVIERIPGLRRVPFNIKVPRETAATTAYWVGQGSPKPVSAGALDTVTLDFNKVAGITFQTQELLKFSRPNSEQIMVNSLTKAIAYLMDRDFLDPSKAVSTGVSPASITNGATSITATGTTADAFRTDFASLISSFSMNNNGSMDGLVIVMSQTQALRLALMRNDFGSKEFPDMTKDGGSIEGIPVVTSENIASNGGSPTDGWIIVAMRADDILLADDGAVDVDISTEASIQADSAPDSPNTASTVLVSLWQNNLVGIRCERFITWAKARSTSVYYITGGNYRT